MFPPTQYWIDHVMRACDLALAVFLFGFAVQISRETGSKFTLFEFDFLTFGFALIFPAVLLIQHRMAAIALCLFNFPCCCGAGVLCDIEMSDTLHASHAWLPLLFPYAFFRALILVGRHHYRKADFGG